MDSNLDDIKVKIGDIIYRFNNVENTLSTIIFNHFKPTNQELFYNLVLNNAVISFAGKVKVVRNILTDVD